MSHGPKLRAARRELLVLVAVTGAVLCLLGLPSKMAPFEFAVEAPRGAYLVADINESYKGKILIRSEREELANSGLRQTELVGENLFFCDRNSADELELRTFSYISGKSTALFSALAGRRYLGVIRSKGYLVFGFFAEADKTLEFLVVSPGGTPSVTSNSLASSVTGVTALFAAENFICAQSNNSLTCFWDKPNQPYVFYGETFSIAGQSGEEARIMSSPVLQGDEFVFPIEFRIPTLYSNGRYVVARNNSQFDTTLTYDGFWYPNGGPIVSHAGGMYFVNLWTPNENQNAYIQKLFSFNEAGTDLRSYDFQTSAVIQHISPRAGNNLTAFALSPSSITVWPGLDLLSTQNGVSWSDPKIKLVAVASDQFVISGTGFVERRSLEPPFSLIERVDGVLGEPKFDSVNNSLGYLHTAATGEPELVITSIIGAPNTRKVPLKGSPLEIAVSSGHHAIAGPQGNHEGALWAYRNDTGTVREIFKPGAGTESSNPRSLTAFNDRLYFIATIRSSGEDRSVIASTSGDAGQFTLEKTAPVGASFVDLFLLNDTLHYELSISKSNGGSTFEVWKGPLASPQRLWQQDLTSQQGVLNRQLANGGILYLIPIFAGNFQIRTDLWVVGPSAQKISQEYIIVPLSPRSPTDPIPEKVYFQYINSSGGSAVYSSDASVAAPTLAAPVGSGESAAFMVGENLILNQFTFENSQLVWRLVRRSPTAGDMPLGSISGPVFTRVNFGARQFVASQRELYLLDTSTWVLTSLAQFSGNEYLAAISPIPVNDRRYFTTLINDAGTIKEYRLWVTDGSVSGTALVKTFSPQGGPIGLGSLDSIFYFMGTNALTGSELWGSDGTPTGTTLADDIWPETPSSAPAAFTLFKDTAFFAASDPENGRELWALDRCPADPLKTDPGTCGCGNGDSDSDGDSVSDCLDQCPSDPIKDAPGTCGCGVADSDTNSNGVSDCKEPPKVATATPEPIPPTSVPTKTPDVSVKTTVISAPNVQIDIGRLFLVLRTPSGTSATVILAKGGAKPKQVTITTRKRRISLAKLESGRWTARYSYRVGNEEFQSKIKKFKISSE